MSQHLLPVSNSQVELITKGSLSNTPNCDRRPGFPPFPSTKALFGVLETRNKASMRHSASMRSKLGDIVYYGRKAKYLLFVPLMCIPNSQHPFRSPFPPQPKTQNAPPCPETCPDACLPKLPKLIHALTTPRQNALPMMNPSRVETSTMFKCVCMH